MTVVEKSEIFHIWHVCDVENFAAIYALSCGAKLSPKGEKMTIMRSGHTNMNHFLNGVQNLDSSQSNKNCELETHVELGFRRRM